MIFNQFSNLIRFFIFFLLSLGFLTPFAFAINPETLPGGVFKLDIQNTNVKTSEYLEDLNTVSMLERLLDAEDVDKALVSGSISSEVTEYDLIFQAGLGADVTLGLVLPMITAKRSSSLDASTDSEAQSFALKYRTAEYSGKGDTQFWLNMRTVYSDEVDFILGVKIDFDDGYADLNDPEKMPLGNGMIDTTYQFRWLYYSSYSTARNVFNLEYTRSDSGKIKDASGDEVSISKSASWLFQYEISYQLDAWEVGFGLDMQGNGRTSIDGNDQKDAYQSGSFKLQAGYGNLSELEQKTPVFPYSLQFEYERSFYGKDAPLEEAFRISASLYF